jgi:superfamily II DNA or RNA helicase/predicted  nucleic acid-binding Zn-ribbon protein
MRTITDIKRNVVLIRSKPAPAPKIIYPLQIDFGEGKLSKGWVSPRECQRNCFASLKNEKYRIITMPTGSGKTVEICCLAAYGLIKNQFKRAIISVPQDVIAAGFIKELVVKLPGCPEYNWGVGNNLCDANEACIIEQIISFLSSVPEEPILVCTHAALVRAFDILKGSSKAALLRNAHLFIDEAHHIQNSEAQNGLPIKNQLGVLASYAVDNDIGLTMTTATYSRHHGNILTESQYKNFKRFDYSFDEYFDTLEIETLAYDFVLYDGLHHKAIAKLIREGVITKDNRVIVYIPKTGQSVSIGTKTDDVQSLKSEFWASWNDLDLVHEEGREERKRQLIENECLDVNIIYTMNMMEEGANWKRADTAIIIGPRYSLPGIIQKLGRLMRDFPGKKNIRLIHLLPFNFDSAKEEEYRNDLNDWLKAVLCSMMLEDVFCPLKIKFKVKQNGRLVDRVRTLNKLHELFPNANEQQEFRVEVIAAVREYAVDEMSRAELRETALDIVNNLLASHGISQSYAKTVRDQLWYEWCRKAIKKNGFDVRAIPLELLNKIDNPFATLLRYTADKIGCNTFADIRKALSIKNMTLDEVKAWGKERGLICLSQKYDGANEPLEWQCEAGHTFTKSFSYMKYSGCYCSYCSGARVTIDDVTELFASIGLELLDQETNPSHEYRCRCIRCGHVQTKSRTHAKLVTTGNGCKQCGVKHQLSHDEMVDRLDKSGFILRSEYTGIEDLHTIECKSCTCIFKSKPNNMRKGGCPFCARKFGSKSIIKPGIKAHTILDDVVDALKPKDLTVDELASKLGISNRQASYYLRYLTVRKGIVFRVGTELPWRYSLVKPKTVATTISESVASCLSSKQTTTSAKIAKKLNVDPSAVTTALYRLYRNKKIIRLNDKPPFLYKKAG